MKRLRVKTFTFGQDSDENWQRVEKAIEGLDIHTINTIHIPAEVREVPLETPVAVESSITNVRIIGNSYIMVVIWYYEEGGEE